jgi:ketosteroid isomerase-like protein
MQDEAGKAVAQALEAYRQAMLGADRAQLEALCMERLTYGHTSGLLQTKSEFIDDVAGGASTWKSLAFTEPSACVVGDTAISRYTFTGESEKAGTVTPLKFSVVMVWKRQDGQWKLLVRQGFNKVL